MEKIISKQNQKVKQWNKLKNSKNRKKIQEYLLESWHLVQEALKTDDSAISKILVTEEEYKKHEQELKNNNKVILISKEVSEYLTSTITPQGIFAIIKIKESSKKIQDITGSWLLLDDVQDPGNIGTMVRTADAVGMKGVVFGKGTVSQYYDKVLRAMQGSQFHLSIIECKLEEFIKKLYKNSVPVYGTELNPQAIDYKALVPQENFGLIMGNEGNGINKSFLKQTTKNLYIPIKGEAESLNVAIAAGVLMFQLKG